MAKDKISDYSSTANSNTDIAGINIDEGCAPSGINDAIRTLMAQLKTWQSGGQDVYIHPAGTASAPSITANGDTNTGIFFPAADTVGISTGGTERARVDSSGNLGLGVTPLNAYTGSGFKAYELPKANIYSFDLGSRPIAGFSVNSYLNSSAVAKYIATGYATLYESDQGQHRFYTAASGTAGNTVTFTQAMTLDASGNLGIGTTSPATDARLHVDGGYIRVTNTNNTTVSGSYVWNSTDRGILLRNSSNTNGTGVGLTMFGGSSANSVGAIYMVQETANALGALAFYTGGANAGSPYAYERARIDSSGNLLVGGTGLSVSNNGFQATPAGRSICSMSSSTSAATTLEVYSTGAGAFRFYVDLGGTVHATSTTITGISDERLKENIRDLDTGLSAVMSLKPRRFDWKEGKGQDKKNAAGFIAQEFETVFPDSVGTSKAGEDGIKYKNICHEELIPTLVKALQELNAKFEAYKASHP